MIKVVKIGAKWCVSCQTTEETFKSFSENHTEIETEVIDADASPEKIEELKVKNIPCLIFLKDGEEKFRKIGGFSSAQLEEWLKDVEK